MNDAKQNLTAEEQSIIDRVEAYRKNHPAYEGRRTLTQREINLSLEQARGIGEL